MVDEIPIEEEIVEETEERYVIDLFKSALTFFLPKEKKIVDDVTYPSITDKYEEIVNNIYVNGTYYLGVDDSLIPTIKEIARSLNEYAYIVDHTTSLRFGVKLKGFHYTQSITITVTYIVDEEERTYTIEDGIYMKNYTHIPLTDEITWENIENITVSPKEQETYKHIKYTSLPTNVYSKDNNLVLLTSVEYDNMINNNVIVQKLLQTPQCKAFRNTEGESPIYGLQFRHITPNDVEDGQEVRMQIDLGGTINVSSANDEWSDEFEYCCSGTRPNDGFACILEVVGTDTATGYKVRLVFDSVDGMGYYDASEVTYL